MQVLELLPLASSSSGNSALLSLDHRHYLIDIGLGRRKLLLELQRCGIEPSRIDGIIITHLHYDHLNPSCLNFCLDFGVPLIMHEANYQAGSRVYSEIRTLMKKALIRPVDRIFVKRGRWKVMGFELPHDPEGVCNGFCVRFGGQNLLAIATDLGHTPPELFDHFHRSRIVFIESNHDVRMLKESDRPAQTKSRILSDYGHLSNEQCASFLAELTASWGPDMILLAHISQECNTPALALHTAKASLQKRGWDISTNRKTPSRETLLSSKGEAIELVACQPFTPGPRIRIFCS